jgi:hypothetical protein
MEYERNKKVDEQAQDIMDIFSQYLDDYTLEDFGVRRKCLLKIMRTYLQTLKKH